jgi:hypothetical protein
MKTIWPEIVGTGFGRFSAKLGPRSPSRSTGLVLKGRSHEKSARRTNSKPHFVAPKTPAGLPSSTQHRGHLGWLKKPNSSKTGAEALIRALDVRVCPGFHLSGMSRANPDDPYDADKHQDGTWTRNPQINTRVLSTKAKESAWLADSWCKAVLSKDRERHKSCFCSVLV